jgi:DNA-binding Lrp family transcriptional regulator
MPLQLDSYDVSILKSLLKDGRKSFREISRETGITTPTVKARFTRLVNVGFIKSVFPIFDFNIIEKENILESKLEDEQIVGSENSTEKEDQNRNNIKSRITHHQQVSRLKIKKG